MSEGRRQYLRAVVQLPGEIQLRGSTRWEKVLIFDLSANGASVHAGIELPLKAEVRLRIHLPGAEGGDSRKIETPCLVVRAGSNVAPNPERHYYAGLHFLSLQGGNRESVRTFVWNRLNSDNV